jgi:hypothetical protein
MISIKSSLLLNRTVLTSLVVAMMSVGFAGCGDDSSNTSNNGGAPNTGNPGASAGYQQDGTSACSANLIDDYNQMVIEAHAMKTEAEGFQDQDHPSHDELEHLRGEAEHTRRDAVNFQQNYAGVSCVASQLGNTVIVNPDKISSVVESCDRLLDLIKKDEQTVTSSSADMMSPAANVISTTDGRATSAQSADELMLKSLN